MTKYGGGGGGGGRVSNRKTSNSRLAWLYSPDTFDFVCPYCFYESFNEHDIRTHVYSCHLNPLQQQHHVATKMSPALEALKHLGTKDGDREFAENPTMKHIADKHETKLSFRPNCELLKRSLVEKSPKITKISRKCSREEENQHSKPSLSGPFLRHLPSAFRLADDVHRDVNGDVKNDVKNDVISSPSRHDNDRFQRATGTSRRLSLPEKARTRASEDDVLGVDRRRSGDLFEIGDDKESSLAEPEAELTAGLMTSLPKGIVSPRGVHSSVIDDLTEKENRRKSLDLASIDQRVDFGSKEGMGSFLKEVIDFLSDGTEDVNDAAPDEKPSLFEKGCCSSSSSYSEAKNDVLAEIGVTRVRSKRIACQQQKGNAAVKGEGVVC